MPRKTERNHFIFTGGKTYPQFQRIINLEGEEKRGSPKDGQNISTGICQPRAACWQSFKFMDYIRSDFSFILDIVGFNQGRFLYALN